MAYKINWVIPLRILLIELENEVPMDEMVRLVEDTHAHVNVGNAPVHIMIDASKLLNRPVDFQEITRISKSMSNPSTGWWILVNAGKMMWFTTQILSKLLQVKLKSAASVDEALTILRRVDLTLEDLPLQALPT